MTEDFLHYIWKYKLFNQVQLQTLSGKVLEVLSSGQHNIDAGPDFFNAKVRMDGQIWAGNVEIHTKTSDWFKHGHQYDKAYDNILLHVVYENDSTENADLDRLVELKPYISPMLLANYEDLINEKTAIPCSGQLQQVDDYTKQVWLERVLIERLETKAARIVRQLELNKNNLEEAFYLQLARNFGFSTNGIPFELLAKSLPIQVFAKHKNSLLSIEALLFGQAGLLDGAFHESYPQQLQKEYRFLKQKFSLQPIDRHLWKYLRLRPANFPSIRIAQFAQLVYKSSHLLAKVIDEPIYSQVAALFQIQASAYWDTHYVFGKEAAFDVKTFGKSAVDNLIINTIVPFLFVYGCKQGNDELKDQAVKLLEQALAENNSIIRQWREIGVKAASAAQSQALLELKNSYCNMKKCLNCAIGLKILNKQ